MKAEGGQMVLQKEAIQSGREGGSQMPKVLVTGKNEQAKISFLFNLGSIRH